MSPGLPCVIRVRPASTLTSSVQVARNSISLRLHRANSGTRPNASILESLNAGQDNASPGCQVAAKRLDVVPEELVIQRWWIRFRNRVWRENIELAVRELKR